MKTRDSDENWDLWPFRIPVFHTSCRLRSSRPFISSCTSRTASTEWLSGVSWLFCTGAAVFTSTCQRVSVLVGMGFWVLGSTLCV